MDVIGFIGLGHMGNPMAKNLLKAKKNVLVYDVVPQAMAALTQEGAQAASSIALMAEQADVIMTSLQTGDQVKDICLRDDGVFKHAKSNLLYIDCSSIDITTTRDLHQAAKDHAIAMLDAPVSGGVSGAEKASLTFMVGGDEKDYQGACALLSLMGTKIIYAGAAGNGQAAKISNNMLLAISMIGVCEAFCLAEKLGLDARKFFEISSNASGQCWAMTSYCPVPGVIENVPANHHYEPGFMAKMMLKDLKLANHTAEAVSALTPLGAVATELYKLYVDQGNGEKDFSGMINLIGGSEI